MQGKPKPRPTNPHRVEISATLCWAREINALNMVMSTCWRRLHEVFQCGKVKVSACTLQIYVTDYRFIHQLRTPYWVWVAPCTCICKLSVRWMHGIVYVNGANREHRNDKDKQYQNGFNAERKERQTSMTVWRCCECIWVCMCLWVWVCISYTLETHDVVEFLHFEFLSFGFVHFTCALYPFHSHPNTHTHSFIVCLWRAL